MAHEPEPTTHEAPLRAVDPAARIQIYFQGILDGACFLYASANAYKALTGKRVTREHWNRAVSSVADPSAFLGGSGATQLHHEDAQRLMETLLRGFSDPGDAFVIDRLSSTAGVAELCDAVSVSSLVVFAYGGRTEFQQPESHIVCGVAATSGCATLHLACSTAFWTRHLESGEYVERQHPQLGRWSNDSISEASTVTIAPNFRWRVSVIDPGSSRRNE